MRIISITVLVLCSFLVKSQTRNVLFLGNSYTQVNNLPQLTSDVALSAGKTLTFEANTPGGYTLNGHSTNSVSLGKIMQSNWDFIVLQEQSQRPSLPIEQVEIDVFPYAFSLDSMIRKYNPCGETMFYMTWGRKNGDASNCSWWPPVCTYSGMDSLLSLRYMIMSDDNNATVSAVGALWKYIRTQYPDIELYALDESHPSTYGSYAAACCFYTVIFREDPMQITYDFNLDATQALNIREATKLIVFDSLSNWYIGNYDLVSDFSYEHSANFEYEFSNLSLNSNAQLWDFGDYTDTVSNPVYSFPGEGIYTVKLSSYSDCDTSVSTQVIAVTISSLATTFGSTDITIFPNPSDTQLNLNNYNSQEKSIKIYNLRGEIVLNIESLKSDNIDIRSLNKGMYLIEIRLEEKKIIKRFIKK